MHKKEDNKNWTEINEMETRKQWRDIIEAQSWCFGMTNEIDSIGSPDHVSLTSNLTHVSHPCLQDPMAWEAAQLAQKTEPVLEPSALGPHTELAPLQVTG